MRKVFFLLGALVLIMAVNMLSPNQTTNEPVAVADAASGDSTQLRVGVQVGHWLNSDLPDELWKLRDYSLGGEVNGVTEWELCLRIAQKLKTDLEDKGYLVDLIPATVPEDYRAAAFISLHMDGNDDATVSGYKTAPSAWDETDRSVELSRSITQALSSLDLSEATYIGDEMSEYYAFNYTKYEHTTDANTPAAIVELGFLTNRGDREYLTSDADKVASTLSRGVSNFLSSL